MTRVKDVVAHNMTRVVDKVISVNITLVTVVVGIGIVVVNLILIDPDICLQIGVVDKDTLVEHRHNDTAVACSTLPSCCTLHIGILHRLYNAILYKLVAVVN